MKPITNMRPIFHIPFALGLIALSLFPPHKAFAQSAQEVFENYFKNWYQVELIIFERIEQTGQDPELWPKNLTLDYPNNLIFLVDESHTENTDASENNPDNDTAETSDSAHPNQQKDDNSQLLETLKRTDLADPLNKKYLELVEQSELDRITPKEKPYTMLDEEISQLNHEAHILGRDRSMRILLHKTWRQPMTNQKQASSILISGGDVFDDHYELEGSIKLFVSRYLHLHTNLWLTEFEANIGQQNEHWPILPKRPAPLEFEMMLPTTASNPEGSEAHPITPQDSPLPISFDTQLDTASPDFNLSFNNSDTVSFGDIGSTSMLNPYALPTQGERTYVVKHIVQMQQKRRMRSGELHYLDHPKLGLLVNIVKYEPEYIASETEAVTDDNVPTP